MNKPDLIFESYGGIFLHISAIHIILADLTRYLSQKIDFILF